METYSHNSGESWFKGESENKHPEDRPLITFALLAYNQEKFIREAVEAAFAQTYEPLEIILSDDCSTDQTFKFIKEMAKGYTGPHKIIVRQNDANSGLTEHVNIVFGTANGEWVVLAAGDDVSLNNRVTEIVNTISKFPSVNMVSSELISINAAGEETGVKNLNNKGICRDVKIIGMRELLDNTAPYGHGATLAYSRNLIKTFPPLPVDAIYEDDIFNFRSALIGLRAHIGDPLVKYRNHEKQTTNLSGRESIQVYRKKNKILSYGAYITYKKQTEDLMSCKNIDQNLMKCIRFIQENKTRSAIIKYWSFKWAWPIRLAPFFVLQLSKSHSPCRLSKKQILTILLPTPLANLIYNNYNRWRS